MFPGWCLTPWERGHRRASPFYCPRRQVVIFPSRRKCTSWLLKSTYSFLLLQSGERQECSIPTLALGQSPLPSSLANAAPSYIYPANICGRRRTLTFTEPLSGSGSVLGLRQRGTGGCAHRKLILELRNRRKHINK